MRFAEIIKSNDWLSVKHTLIRLYPEQTENIEGYKKVFEKLHQLEITEDNIKIEIEQDYNDETGDLGAAHVFGTNDSEKNQITNGLAIEFVPWTRWLGMNISERTRNEFDELEIIVHCLNEMTYSGFDEQEIESRFSEIIRIVDEYENMSEEEKKLNTMSFEEMTKKLNEHIEKRTAGDNG